MKRILFLLAIALPLMFSSCSKDDEPKFDYDINKVYGTWEVYEVNTGSGYITWLLEKTSATFKSDGSYVGKGYFGNGTGTYKTEGKTITCYVSGKEYLKYDIINLAENTCELRMYITESEEDIKIKCKKK